MTPNSLPSNSSYVPNEVDAFLSACKGEPYTPQEWEQHIAYLEAELREAKIGLRLAQHHDACPAARFAGPLRDEIGKY